jgi:beta-glucosidase
MGVKEHGEAFMRARFEQSAVRLLRNIFSTGLFENPYLDPVVTTKKTVVGSPAFMDAGYQAQLKSIVMLKNKGERIAIANRQNRVRAKKIHPGRA